MVSWPPCCPQQERRPCAPLPHSRADIGRPDSLGLMPANRRTRTFSVLFVDDEPDNLLVLRATFSRRFEVLTAPDGASALAVLAAHPVAVMVTDQRMPGMTGIELCATVRQRWPQVRRIVLTAWGDRNATLAAINEGGVHAFFDKPWQVEVLDLALTDTVAEATLAQRESQLRTALLERERLLAMDAIRRRVAHDLGSACTVAQLSFDALQHSLAPLMENLPRASGDETQQTLQILAQSLDIMSGLQLQLRQHHNRLERAPTLLNVAEQLAIIARLVPPADVDRVHFVAATDLNVWVDGLHFSRILINLVYNALRMVRDKPRPDGQVRVTCGRAEDGNVRIDVRDDGPGVSESLRDRIFEAGFSTRSDGSGLGLAISRDLAIGEGGTLILAATECGGGAHFVLTLLGGENSPANP